jgi:hypothetical protein
MRGRVQNLPSDKHWRQRRQMDPRVRSLLHMQAAVHQAVPRHVSFLRVR